MDEELQQAAKSENINVEVSVDDSSYFEGVKTDWDCNDDSQEYFIPVEDDSEINEEFKNL